MAAGPRKTSPKRAATPELETSDQEAAVQAVVADVVAESIEQQQAVVAGGVEGASSAGSPEPLPHQSEEHEMSMHEDAPAEHEPPTDIAPVVMPEPAAIPVPVADSHPAPALANAEPVGPGIQETAAAETVSQAAAVSDIVETTAVKAETTSKHTMETVMKTAEEFLSFGQGNVEAFLKAGQIMAAGMQDMSKTVAALAQAQLDETVTTWKALAGVKSVKEAIDLQSTFARSAMEKALSETGKITEHSMKLAEQAIAPISARMTLAVEKFGRPA